MSAATRSGLLSAYRPLVARSADLALSLRQPVRRNPDQADARGSGKPDTCVGNKPPAIVVVWSASAGEHGQRDRYCIDLLAQISGIQGRLDKVASGLLDDHGRYCGRGAEGDEKADETTSRWPPSGGSCGGAGTATAGARRSESG